MGLGWFCRIQNFPNAVMLVQSCFILKAGLILAYLLVGGVYYRHIALGRISYFALVL